MADRIMNRPFWPPAVTITDSGPVLPPMRRIHSAGGCLPADSMVFDTGPVWMVARTGSVEELIGLRADRNKLTLLSTKTGDSVGIILYALNDENGIEVRALAPAAGVDEDPVCGSGNLAAAAHLKATGLLARLGNGYQARQGRHLGRDGRLFLLVGKSCFELGGQALTVIDGTINP